MTIKEVEERTGLSRSNIRFYEREELIQPKRSEHNGYRDYSMEDIQNIKKIAYLRTLGISVENIRRIISGELSLYLAVSKQAKLLQAQMNDLENARDMCEKMLAEKNINYESLEVEAYISELPEYVQRNRQIFLSDTVSFIYLWGGIAVWGVLTALCLLTALISFPGLPEQIPVQWQHGIASSLVNKKFIFAYPAACILLRFLLRPFIWRWLQLHMPIFSDTIANYITNFLCFAALSFELFSILFVYGVVKHITVLVVANIIVFIGLLAAGLYKMLQPKQ